MTSFWGLIIESGKRYKQDVADQFHLTMAVLDTASVKGNQKNANVNVMVECRNTEFILCSLNADSRPQERLDLMFAEGETVSFFTTGEGTVHLTGYVMPEEEPFDDMYDEEEEELSDLDEVEQPVVNGKRKQSEQLQLQGQKKLKANDNKKAEKQSAVADLKKQKIIDVDPKQLNEKNNKQQQQQKAKQQLAKQLVKKVAESDDDDDDVDSEIDSVELEKLINEASEDDDDDMGDFDDDDDDDDDLEDDEDDDLDDEDSAEEKMLKVQQKLKANLSGQTPNNKQQQAKTPNKQQQQNQPKTPQQQKNVQQQQGKTPQQGKQNQQSQQKNNQNNQKGQQTPFGNKNNKQNQQQQNSNKKGTPFQKNNQSNQKDETTAAAENKVNKSQSNAENKTAEQRKEQNVKKLPNGLVIHDIVEGSGPEAKKGKFLHMNYVGKLTNNKVFDKTTNRPFSFRLGMGEVIKGWDQGIQGMKVGGKRRLTIPASLGYGKTGAGKDIPPNATLVFDVELKGVSS